MRGESREAQPRHRGGSHANTELGRGRQGSPLPVGTGSTGGTQTHGWDTGAEGLGELGAWRRTCGEMWDTNQSLCLWFRECPWRIKPQIQGRKRSTWRNLPSHCIPLSSARLLHSGIFCCWKGSAFILGRLRDSAAWELPHLHNQPQFPLQTHFSSLHVSYL